MCGGAQRGRGAEGQRVDVATGATVSEERRIGARNALNVRNGGGGLGAAAAIAP